LRVDAAMQSFVATADGDVTVLGGGGTTVVTNESTIDFGLVPPTPDEGFGILEFDLSLIDQAAPLTVLSASLTGRFDAVRIPDSDVDFRGYPADLTIDASDASAGATSVGTLVDINAGSINVPIDTSFIEAILNDAVADPFVGIRAIVTDGTSIRMESTEWLNGTEPPTLTIEYIPEPATLSVLMLGAGVLAHRRHRH
jgi:hypothetical protein